MHFIKPMPRRGHPCATSWYILFLRKPYLWSQIIVIWYFWKMGTMNFTLCCLFSVLMFVFNRNLVHLFSMLNLLSKFLVSSVHFLLCLDLRWFNIFTSIVLVENLKNIDNELTNLNYPSWYMCILMLIICVRTILSFCGMSL